MDAAAQDAASPETIVTLHPPRRPRPWAPAYFNPHSLIAARHPDPRCLDKTIDEAFLRMDG